MNRFAAASSALVISALVVACGSSSTTSPSGTSGGTPVTREGTSGGPAATAASCTPVDAPKCGASRKVATAEAFLDEQRALAWQGVASSKSGQLSASGDLIATADLAIDASTLSKSPKCAAAIDAGTPALGCSSVVFREDAWPRSNGTARVAGAGCAVPRQQVRRGWGELCTKLTIASGTVFRMRNTVLDDHPSGEVQAVEIIAPCTAPCASGEARCEASQMCLPLGYETCAFCEGKAVATCACRAACAVDANGAECNYDKSPDQPVSGACQAGECVTSR